MKQTLSRRIDSAQRDADAARARVVDTLSHIRHRLDPRIIAKEAADDLVVGVNRMLAQTTEAAKARPWAIGLGATVVGLAIALVAKTAVSDDDDDNDTPEPTKQKIADKS